MSHWFVKHPKTGVTLLDVPAPDKESAILDALQHSHVKSIVDQFGTLTVQHVLSQEGQTWTKPLR